MHADNWLTDPLSIQAEINLWYPWSRCIPLGYGYLCEHGLMISIDGTCGLGSCSDQISQQATRGGSTNIDMRYIQSMKIEGKIRYPSRQRMEDILI